MSVVGIDQVNFVVERSDEAEAFLLQWGLDRIDDETGVRFECADGSAVAYVEAAASRPVADAPFGNLERVIWGVSNQAALDGLANDLARDRAIAQDGDGGFHTLDDNGMGIGLRVTRKRPLEAHPILFNTPGAPARIDQSATFYDSARPQEISHIVLGVADLAAGEAFYRERLGFHVSDRYIGRGVFLRGPATGTHHNLFMLDDGETTFNHLAFKVRDIHEVIGGGQALAKQGAETLVGPGRHYASSGCFWYFKSPFGGAMEYVADEDIVTPAWTPNDLVPSPERFSEWVFHTKDAMGALKKGH